MGGFSSVTNDETIMFADNASFDGTKRGGAISTDGQLWIGSSVLPHVRPSTPTINANGNLALGNGSLQFNPYNTAKWIVDPLNNIGTHTTIGGALAAAVSGETIFVRPGTYTENLTLKSGVNITAFTGDQSLAKNATTFNVKIIGKLTADFSGNCEISNICLQTNSDVILAVSGANSTTVALNSCFLNITNNTGISCSASGGVVQLNNCYGSLANAAIAYFVFTGGGVEIYAGNYVNSGSTTASTFSNSVFQALNTTFISIISTTNTSLITARYTYFGVSDTASIVLTGTTSTTLDHCVLVAGTAAALTVGAGCTANVQNCTISSSNTNVISGAGSITYGELDFSSSSSNISVTTQAISTSGPSISVGATNTGATNTLTVTNPSNTASSASTIIASVGGGTSADPSYQAVVSGVTTWSWGADNSDSDAFVLSASATLGSTNVLRSTVAGIISMPLQPRFSAYLSSTASNVTGDATNYTVIYDTENYDIGSNFNTGTGLFTAPVTGLYNFSGVMYLQEIGAAHLTLNLVSTTGHYYQICNPFVNSVGGVYMINWSVQEQLAAAATFGIAIVVSGGTKTVDLLGGNYINIFNGYLLAST